MGNMCNACTTGELDSRKREYLLTPNQRPQHMRSPFIDKMKRIEEHNATRPFPSTSCSGSSSGKKNPPFDRRNGRHTFRHGGSRNGYSSYKECSHTDDSCERPRKKMRADHQPSPEHLHPEPRIQPALGEGLYSGPNVPLNSSNGHNEIRYSANSSESSGQERHSHEQVCLPPPDQLWHTVPPKIALSHRVTNLVPDGSCPTAHPPVTGIWRNTNESVSQPVMFTMKMTGNTAKSSPGQPGIKSTTTPNKSSSGGSKKKGKRKRRGGGSYRGRHGRGKGARGRGRGYRGNRGSKSRGRSRRSGYRGRGGAGRQAPKKNPPPTSEI